jgi:hypothetical protein
MSEYLQQQWIERAISRRTLLRGGVTVAAVAALPSSAAGRAVRASIADGGIANVRVSRDRYGVHVGPSLAANPLDPRQLLVACQAATTGNPDRIATYISLDAGATWQSGGQLSHPAGKPPAGDDVTVAFDPQGRGYLSATGTGGSDAQRTMYCWRTDDGGQSFSAPVILVTGGEYFDQPWIAAGAGRQPSQRNVYVVWASDQREGGNSVTMRRSTDGGHSFEPERTILNAHRNTTQSATPKVVAGPDGLVCIAADESSQWAASGDLVGHVVVTCSTDAGRNFAAPVQLGWESVTMSLPGGVLPNAGVQVAAARHSAALYVTFVRHQPRAGHSDIFVCASYNRGRTWSRPITATPQDSAVYFQPNVAVDDAGRVAISAFALAHGRISEVLLLSPPHQLNFSAPLQVTTAPFDPHSSTATGPKHGAWWIGDYQGITAAPGAIHLVWNDTRTGKMDLYAATVRSSPSS